MKKMMCCKYDHDHVLSILTVIVWYHVGVCAKNAGKINYQFVEALLR
jgi:hypothetical protein